MEACGDRNAHTSNRFDDGKPDDPVRTGSTTPVSTPVITHTVTQKKAIQAARYGVAAGNVILEEEAEHMTLIIMNFPLPGEAATFTILLSTGA